MLTGSQEASQHGVGSIVEDSCTEAAKSLANTKHFTKQASTAYSDIMLQVLFNCSHCLIMKIHFLLCQTHFVDLRINCSVIKIKKYHPCNEVLLNVGVEE